VATTGQGYPLQSRRENRGGSPNLHGMEILAEYFASQFPIIPICDYGSRAPSTQSLAVAAHANCAAATWTFGSGMTCRRRLRDWHEAGVWQQLHERCWPNCTPPGVGLVQGGD
jgi:hypothetical protein